MQASDDNGLRQPQRADTFLAPDPPRRRMTPSLLRSETFMEVAAILSRKRISALLIFVPVAIILGALRQPARAVFCLNFLALGALAPVITMAVLKLSTKAGPIWGGILRSVLGNAVELIIGIVAMIYGEVLLAQCTIIGSTLTYSLFVLGGSFLYASYGKPDVKFSKTQTSLMATLIMAASTCLVCPTIISVTSKAKPPRHHSGHSSRSDTHKLSHGIAIILIVLFISYIRFRYRSHNQIFPRHSSVATIPTTSRPVEEEPRPEVGPIALSAIILGATASAVICANYLLRSFQVIIPKLDVSTSFVGLVVLPLTGNMIKSIVVISASRTRVLDLGIRIIMTSVLDALLFMMPVLVLLGWIINKHVELEFGSFEAIVFLLSMMIMTYIVQHGKATYFEGFMLIGTYITVVAAFFVRPEVPGSGPLSL